jgi:signal transduction histidine kinase
VGVAEAALRIHQNRIKRRNIRLITDLPEQLTAPLHFGEMLQVVSNLLANALHALPDGGSLRLYEDSARNVGRGLSHIRPWPRSTAGTCLAALLVQLQPVIRSVSFDQRSPRDFLNKPGVIDRSLMDLLPAAECSFMKLL